MTEEQVHALAVALEASYQADDRTGYSGADLVDQFMAAVPQPDISDIADRQNLYAHHVRLANDPGCDQRAIDYIRCKCVLVALEVAYIRGDLVRNRRKES